MPLVGCRFRSDVLQLSMSMQAIIPAGPVPPSGHPVLYLLHGLSDDDTAWLRLTGIERYVRDRGLAVVMPQAHRSFYADQRHGDRYWTFLSEELPVLCDQLFHLASDPRDTFVAGLSMGGYGAVKWALSEPSRFAAAASFSGALGLAGRTTGHGASLAADVWDASYDGADLTGGPDDLLWLLNRAGHGSLPRLWVSCGTEDPMLPETIEFIDAAQRLSLDLTADLRPGDHSWDFWDDQIRRVIDWLPLRAPAATHTPERE